MPLVVLAVVAGLTACAEKVDETKPPQLAANPSKPICESRDPNTIKFFVSIRVKAEDPRSVGYRIIIANSETNQEVSNKPGARALSGKLTNNEIIVFNGPSRVTVVSEFGQQLSIGEYKPDSYCSV